MRRFVFVVFLLVFSFSVSAQRPDQYKKALRSLLSRGEVYLKFESSEIELLKLSKFVTIDHVDGGRYLYAYANIEQFAKLQEQFSDYEVEVPPSLRQDAKMAKKKDEVKKSWDSYPTYEQYVAMMEEFAAEYPSLCQLEEFGESVEGRKLLAVKISDNVIEEESEPNFLYSSTLHGDELVGYVLTLRLIDYLLTNYDTDNRVRDLVDNTEIWINPLSNPDGTFAGGNSTVNGATRGNSLGVDLNRNFPDPRDGEHPDGREHQVENIAMMEFMKKHNFVLSANLHSGEEVVNYPWDTWSALHADDEWWKLVSYQYADTVHQNAPSNYLQYGGTGVTRGAVWYIITGGRQDYTTYFLHGREFTLELSKNKLLAGSSLPAHWEYNYRSLLNYIKQTHYGIMGIVTNRETGEPIRAKIELVDHDFDNSEVYSEAGNGNYHRLVAEGSYDVRVSKNLYETKTISDVQVLKDQKTELNVELEPLFTSVRKRAIASIELFPNPIETNSQLCFTLNSSEHVAFEVFSLAGKQLYSYVDFYESGMHTLPLNHLNVPPGVYIGRVKIGMDEKRIKLVVSQ